MHPRHFPPHFPSPFASPACDGRRGAHRDAHRGHHPGHHPGHHCDRHRAEIRADLEFGGHGGGGRGGHGGRRGRMFDGGDLKLLVLQILARQPSHGYEVIKAIGEQVGGDYSPSPGTIYEPEGEARDYWRTARALHAAGFRSGELIHNSFSYHMTPAGSIMECGARALGCTVLAGGTGQTEQQLEAMVDLKPEGYAGTPSFLKILLEKAEEKGLKL